MSDTDKRVRRPVTEITATAVRPGRHLQVPERLATEEPMEIRVVGPGQDPAPVAVTMRTPGNDFELAAGFLLTEGLLGDAGAVASVGYCRFAHEDQRFNTVTVSITRRWDPAVLKRNFIANSSCGVCGKTTLDDVALVCPPVPLGPRLAASLIVELPGRLRQAQRIFDQTGGLHAAGLFRPDGELAVLREDVGRHNAVDKVVGFGVLGRQSPAPGSVLMVSGRLSFEIVQKAAMAGVGTIAAVSAPSSLAVEAADRLGITCAGFVRDSTYNLYTHPERIDLNS